MVSNKLKFLKSSSFIAILLTVTIVAAIWWWGSAQNITGLFHISSKEPNVTISKVLTGGELDLSDNSSNFTDYITIDSNVNEKALVWIETIKEDNLTDSCTDYLNDCNVSYYFGDNVYGYGFPVPTLLEDGDTIQLQKGEQTITTFLECAKWSCDQTITANITVMLKEN